MPDRSPHLAARRPTQPLWWFHRHLNEDQLADMVAAIVDTEIDLAGDRAATSADTEYLYLSSSARAELIARATRDSEDWLRREAIAAVEHYVAAKRADLERQRHQHMRAHGCTPRCNTLRGRS